ncbi:hypothetical protein BDV98DRAFT_594988 [Pterulicium gracile]|uniref:Transmembrane protein n=1 Tax=Pterulicium gracile TaxID=1884261 RepID=A0A5C3QB56_9AGAR|nr:hypothetical protein BDV98DRAFT_594988 [Pterula gracilis]
MPFSDLESQVPVPAYSVALPPRAARASYDSEIDSHYSTEKHSRHCRSPSTASLPPYAPNSDPVDSGEDQTVAELAFKYGFFFPVLWIYGAYILISPLRVPPTTSALGWLPDKTESEKEVYLERQRREEVVWARRSLIALVALLLVVCVVVGVVVGVVKSRA